MAGYYGLAALALVACGVISTMHYIAGGSDGELIYLPMFVWMCLVGVGVLYMVEGVGSQDYSTGRIMQVTIVAGPPLITLGAYLGAHLCRVPGCGTGMMLVFALGVPFGGMIATGIAGHLEDRRAARDHPMGDCGA